MTVLRVRVPMRVIVRMIVLADIAAIATQWHYVARRIVRVIVMMVINGHLGRHLVAEHGNEGGVAADRGGRAGTADILVDARHPIRHRHDLVQIVRNQKDAQVPFVADTPDQFE